METKLLNSENPTMTEEISSALEDMWQTGMSNFIQDVQIMYSKVLEAHNHSDFDGITPSYHEALVWRMFQFSNGLRKLEREIDLQKYSQSEKTKN